jgi:hypothetical protein
MDYVSLHWLVSENQRCTLFLLTDRQEKFCTCNVLHRKEPVAQALHIPCNVLLVWSKLYEWLDIKWPAFTGLGNTETQVVVPRYEIVASQILAIQRKHEETTRLVLKQLAWTGYDCRCKFWGLREVHNSWPLGGDPAAREEAEQGWTNGVISIVLTVYVLHKVHEMN